MRIGMVCPYAWDIPGGVQAHVRDLAETLLGLGHTVSVLTPCEGSDAELPPYATSAGRPVAVPYNGSVARLLLGPVSAARVRRWLRDGRFDVLHLHEPVAPSVSMLASWFATGPIVATFHTANARSRAMTTLEPLLIPALEKVRGRIAVSDAARRTTVDHLGGDAVLIPNGVDVAGYRAAEPLPGYPAGRTVVFVGRADEPRKGLAVLLDALPLLGPEVRLLVAGRGEVSVDPAVAGQVEVLGQVSETAKRRLLRTADVFVAPNTGGESFGIILLEAMAAGAPVVASDLDAFRRVLADGTAGQLFRTGDPAALATAVRSLLDEPARAAAFAAAAAGAVEQYDWPRVAAAVLAVYETVAASTLVGVRE